MSGSRWFRHTTGALVELRFQSDMVEQKVNKDGLDEVVVYEPVKGECVFHLENESRAAWWLNVYGIGFWCWTPKQRAPMGMMWEKQSDEDELVEITEEEAYGAQDATGEELRRRRAFRDELFAGATPMTADQKAPATVYPTMVSDLITMLQAFQSEYGDMPICAMGFDHRTARLSLSWEPDYYDGGCLLPAVDTPFHVQHWIRSRTAKTGLICWIRTDEPCEEEDTINGAVLGPDDA